MAVAARSDLRQFAAKAPLLVVAALLIVTINWFMDPANLFDNKCAEDGAALLLQGLNVENVDNCDDRMLQKHYIHDLRHSKDTIVLGSSRSLGMGYELFGGTSTMNHAVYGATLEDYLATWELYVERGLRPRLVVVGVDPWVLNRNHGQVRWRSLETEYLAALNRMHVKRPPGRTFIPAKYRELISPTYFRHSVAKLGRVMAGRTPSSDMAASPTQSTMNEFMTKLADGSLSYGREMRTRSPARVRTIALESIEMSPVYSLESFSELDPEYKHQLEAFLQFLRRDGVDVELFLPPYHPDVYRRLVSSEKYRSLAAAEEYVRAVARRIGLSVRGSYDPARSSCSADEFYDAYHAKRSCIAKAFAGPGH